MFILVDKWMDGCLCDQVDGWMFKLEDGQMDAYTSKWMDVYIGRWMDFYTGIWTSFPCGRGLHGSPIPIERHMSDIKVQSDVTFTKLNIKEK